MSDKDLLFSQLISFFLTKSGTRSMPNLFPLIFKKNDHGNKSGQLSHLFTIFDKKNDIKVLLQNLVDNLSRMWDTGMEQDFNNLIKSLGLICAHRRIYDKSEYFQTIYDDFINLNGLYDENILYEKYWITKKQLDKIIEQAELSNNFKEKDVSLKKQISIPNKKKFLNKNDDDFSMNDSNIKTEEEVSEHILHQEHNLFTTFNKNFIIKKKLIFVLMPFSPNKLTQIYERYIKKPLEKKGFIVKRADDYTSSSIIIEDIWRAICEAELIIAELTDKNPNVFYELGLAHLKGKYVIHISQKQSIPFDVLPIRTIMYNDTPKGYETLERELMKYLETFLNK